MPRIAALVFLATLARAQSIPSTDCTQPPQPAPKPPTLAAADARQLAYYSAGNLHVLAPRDWHCFTVTASNGTTLFVTPNTIDTREPLYADPSTGPVVLASYHVPNAPASRVTIAELIARAFPQRRDFIDHLRQSIPAAKLPDAPYSTDTLIHKSPNIVEFTTPARTEGIGKQPWMQINSSAIDGVAILTGEGDETNAAILSVRLPQQQRTLAPAIIRQFEIDAPKSAR